MKANSRRRVLISSMAMLLVALVALGTATYAWFTTSTQATASRLNVKTIKSSTLEVATDNEEYDTTVYYFGEEDEAKVLLPASSANGVNWFTGTATSKDSYESNGTFTSLDNLGNYVYVNELNIRNAGEAPVDNVTVKFQLTETGATGTKYARVALVPISAPGADIDTSASGYDFSDYVYDIGGQANYAAVNAASGAGNTTTMSANDATSTVTVNVTTGEETLDGVTKDQSGNITAYDTRSYKVLVWFEGQDPHCVDANAGHEVPNITFTVSADVADQI